ncbi:MAG: aldehyde dehydrogenase [Bacteroidales bacterium]|jgi:aldehyde dehydrogenase (NAD+)|nr:aldehyde dehydrogenase [Bacteroidales bacterium]
MKTSEIFEQQQNFFLSGQTRPIAFRKQQLRKFKEALKRNETLLYEAIDKDFGKSAYETYETELSIIYHEINQAIQKVKKWSRPRRVATNLANFPGKSRIIPEPYGTTLVIGAWNYPYQLALVPAVSAIAAGNTVVIKPSELAPNTSAIMANIFNKIFNAEFLYVKEGGVPETTELLEQKFDKLFFTGSTRVGKIVYQAAAKNLTPVTLELGGKSPVFVLPDTNLKMAAKRIAWGKFLNAGQTCVAPDYLLVHKAVKDTFLKELKHQIIKIQGENPKGSEAYVRIINQANFERLSGLIDQEKIYYGGETDAENLYISPTVLHQVTFNDKVMEEEIFGPVLPVLTFANLDEAIDGVRELPRPLSLYIFSNKRTIRKKIIQKISFGGGCVNDTIMHLANPKLPFGGVGNSGIGNYHGKTGFNTFSHQKSVLYKGMWFEPFVKYRPYSRLKMRLLRWIVE